jgi:hypothetical protein
MPFTGNVRLSATISPYRPTWYTTTVATGAISALRVTAKVRIVFCIFSSPLIKIIPFDMMM